jgi:hypothetical protein
MLTWLNDLLPRDTASYRNVLGSVKKWHIIEKYRGYAETLHVYDCLVGAIEYVFCCWRQKYESKSDPVIWLTFICLWTELWTQEWPSYMAHVHMRMDWIMNTRVTQLYGARSYAYGLNYEHKSDPVLWRTFTCVWTEVWTQEWPSYMAQLHMPMDWNMNTRVTQLYGARSHAYGLKYEHKSDPVLWRTFTCVWTEIWTQERPSYMAHVHMRMDWNVNTR